MLVFEFVSKEVSEDADLGTDLTRSWPCKTLSASWCYTVGGFVLIREESLAAESLHAGITFDTRLDREAVVFDILSGTTKDGVEEAFFGGKFRLAFGEILPTRISGLGKSQR